MSYRLQPWPARTDGLAGVRTSTRTANGHGAEARIDAHLIDMGIFVLQTITGSIRPMVPTVELDQHAEKASINLTTGGVHPFGARHTSTLSKRLMQGKRCLGSVDAGAGG